MTSPAKPLAGRAAVITGASAGIGEAVARDLARSGAAVVVNARRADRLDALVRALAAEGARAIPVPGDATQQSTIDAMLDAAPARLGTEADIVVVNAGRGLAGSVLSSDTSQWEEMLATNVLAAARLIRSAGNRLAELSPAARPLARPRDLVVLGSNVGRHISPFSSMYGSTKFAVGALAEAARRELGPRGVRVTLILPGIVKSEFQSVAGYDPAAFGQFMEKVGPVLTPDDVARAITFVVSQPPHVHINEIVIRPTRQDYP